jgi:hypothetical protein
MEMKIQKTKDSDYVKALSRELFKECKLNTRVIKDKRKKKPKHKKKLISDEFGY